jgi:PleD family two-component response regulator
MAIIMPEVDLRAADRALYRAKASGRNCVVESFELVVGLPDA